MFVIIKYALYAIALYFFVISIYDFQEKEFVFSKLYVFVSLVCYYLTTIINRAKKEVNQVNNNN